MQEPMYIKIHNQIKRDIENKNIKLESESLLSGN